MKEFTLLSFYHKEEEGDDFKIISVNRDSKKQERRVWKRKKLETRVIVEFGSEIFFSSLKNISLGGLALSEDLPASLRGKDCDFYISDPDSREKIYIKGTTQLNGQGRNRVRFAQVTPKQTFLLQDLVNGGPGARAG